MPTAEVILLGLLLLSLWQVIRLSRQVALLRHLFIDSSDWCARTIDEVARAAESDIAELAILLGKERGHVVSQESALGYVSDIIRVAKPNWTAQKNRFQAMLLANGMKPLDEGDLDRMILFAPKWLKRVPYPQFLHRLPEI